MKKICLNIGCGKDIKKSTKNIKWINIDGVDDVGVALVIDLTNDRLINHFKKDSVDEIFCSHFIEHLVNPVEFIFDCLFVLKKDGVINVFLPNTPISQLYHYRDLHGLSYFNCLENKLKSNQSVYNVEVESFLSSRHKGFKRFFLRNTWYFRDWFFRRFYDETKYIIKKK